MLFSFVFLVLGWDVAMFHVLPRYLGDDNATKRKLFILGISTFIVLTQALGNCIGFSSAFAFPRSSLTTVSLAFGYGLLSQLLYFFLCLIPHCVFQSTFDAPVALSTFIFPITYTFTSHVVLGDLTFSSFSAVGNAVLDYEPLRQLASLGGVSFITFLVCLSATAAAIFVGASSSPSRAQQPLQGPSDPPTNRETNRSMHHFLQILIPVLSVLLAYGGYSSRQDSFYQRNVDTQVFQTVNVSCVTAQALSSRPEHAPMREQVWANTAARIQNGDAVVMWAEEGFTVHDAADEKTVLSRARKLITDTDNCRSYLGITYMLRLEGESLGSNRFVLLDPNGNTLWSYAKANPVPLIESNIAAGPKVIPVADTRYGRLGGAVCFDMDYPDLIAQAGRLGVSIMLQPSWTWGALFTRHFDGNALRAVENGFSIFRCSSDGESGIVSPRGRVLARQYTGHDPTQTVSFTLPLQTGTKTVYSTVGYSFNGVLITLSSLVYVILMFRMCPLSWAVARERSSRYVYRAMDEGDESAASDPSSSDDVEEKWAGGGEKEHSLVQRMKLDPRPELLATRRL